MGNIKEVEQEQEQEQEQELEQEQEQGQGPDQPRFLGCSGPQGGVLGKGHAGRRRFRFPQRKF